MGCAAENLISCFTWERKGQSLVQVKESKIAPMLEVPASKIADYPFVVPNRWRYSLLQIDVDEPRIEKREAFDTGFFDGIGLPLPNTVTLSKRGYHALWALEYPLARDGNGMRYFRAIRTTYNAALNGDFSCSANAATRNPFYHDAESVCFGTWRRELAKLDVPFNGDRPGFRAHSTKYEIGNRNTATFLHLLTLYKCDTTFNFERLLECAESFQAEHAAPPLTRADNSIIAASVLRNGERYSVGNPNRGRLGLPAREGSLPLDEFKAWKAEHQALGAAYARGCLVGKTKARIQAAVDSLQGKVTVSAVARVAGVDPKTARKYLNPN